MKHGTKPKFKYKRVKIIWQDIVTDPSWYDSLEDVEKLTYSFCEDVGYLFSKDAKMVKKILEITKNKVMIKDLYEAWYEAKI